MAEPQLDYPRDPDGVESVERPQEVNEATDEELSAAIAEIELEENAPSELTLSSPDESPEDPFHAFEADESGPTFDRNDRSKQTLTLEEDDDSPEQPTDDATDTATQPYGLRDLLARIL